MLTQFFSWLLNFSCVILTNFIYDLSMLYKQIGTAKILEIKLLPFIKSSEFFKENMLSPLTSITFISNS